MIKIIKIGIAGYGVVGKRRHFFLKKNSNFNVIAICDQNDQNLNRQNKNINFFKSYKNMLDMDLDAIFRKEKT